MRPITGLLLTLAAMAASGANARPAHLTAAQRALLLDDVFADKGVTAERRTQTFAAAPLSVRSGSRSTLATGAVFALPPVTGSSLDQTHLINTERLVEGQGLAVWNSREISYPARGGAVDTLRVSVGGVARGPGGVVTARPDSLMAPDAEAFDVSFTRGWPSAWSVGAGRYALDVSPHAGIGFSGAGESAEAGALVRFGRNVQGRMANRLGLQATTPPGADGEGRWFLFAAASGQAVGLNMAPSPDGGLPRSAWSEPSTALVSDAQAGLGWRRGDLQASIGYVHRSVRNQTVIAAPDGPSNYHDSMVAFSFSIIPH